MAAISKHSPAAEKSLEYLRTGRGMPWVKLGMRVDVNGRPAKIIGGTDNLVIRYDGTKSKTYAHPSWKTAYYDEDGKLIAVNGKLICEPPEVETEDRPSLHELTGLSGELPGNEEPAKYVLPDRRPVFDDDGKEFASSGKHGGAS